MSYCIPVSYTFTFPSIFLELASHLYSSEEIQRRVQDMLHLQMPRVFSFFKIFHLKTNISGFLCYCFAKFFCFWNLSDRCGLGPTGRIMKRSCNSKLSFLASLKIWCGEGRGFLEQRAIISGPINNAFSRQQLGSVRQIYMHYACKRKSVLDVYDKLFIEYKIVWCLYDQKILLQCE